MVHFPARHVWWHRRVHNSQTMDFTFGNIPMIAFQSPKYCSRLLQQIQIIHESLPQWPVQETRLELHLLYIFGLFLKPIFPSISCWFSVPRVHWTPHDSTSHAAHAAHAARCHSGKSRRGHMDFPSTWRGAKHFDVTSRPWRATSDVASVYWA